MSGHGGHPYCSRPLIGRPCEIEEGKYYICSVPRSTVKSNICNSVGCILYVLQIFHDNFHSTISKHHCPPVEHGKGCVQGFSFACSNKCDISVEVPAMMEILWHTTIVTMYTYTYMPSIPLQWPCQSHKGRSVPREVCGHSTLL